jgi:hypothetical protein
MFNVMENKERKRVLCKIYSVFFCFCDIGQMHFAPPQQSSWWWRRRCNKFLNKSNHLLPSTNTHARHQPDSFLFSPSHEFREEHLILAFACKVLSVASIVVFIVFIVIIIIIVFIFALTHNINPRYITHGHGSC